MIANKENYKDVELYDMRWHLQAVEEAIKEKKNNDEEKVIEEYGKMLIDLKSNNELTDKELMNILRYVMKEIRQIERTV